MAQYLRNRIDDSRVIDDGKAIKILTSPSDMLNLEETMRMMDDNKLKEYALNHPEKNMIELFKEFGYPVPENEEEIQDPRFYTSLLYIKDSEGKLKPRENIFWNEKYVKNYQNPLNSFYSLLHDTNVDTSKIVEYKEKEEEPYGLKLLKQAQNKKYDKTINSFLKNYFKEQNNYSKQKNQKIKKNDSMYASCMKYYSKIFENKIIQNITADDINSLGDIYYIIKNEKEKEILSKKKEYKDLLNNESDDDDDFFPEGSILRSKKNSLINLLLKNSSITEKEFGPKSIKQGESQILCDLLESKKLESQKSNDINSKNKNISQNFLYDEYSIFLILKAKRIELNNSKEKNKFFFKLYLQDKLIDKPVEVVYEKNICRDKYKNFKKIMENIKIGEEILISFIFNAIIYFNFVNGLYINFKPYDKIYYLDCSKVNNNINSIFDEINN